jgi:midasin (ATPase involved in ribosome maturation)
MYCTENAALIPGLFRHQGCLYEVTVAETIGGKPMVRFRSNVMSIFVASTLVLFVAPVKNAFAHAASPAAAKAFSAQATQDGQGQHQDPPGQGQSQDIQDDRNEGPDKEVNEGPSVETEGASEKGQEKGEVAEMDGDHNDGALHESQVDEDRTEDQQNDEHEDVAPAPPAAS